MHPALAALRILVVFVVGLGLGISALQVVGVVQPDLAGLLLPIIIYAVIGGAILMVVPPTAGGFLIVGWAMPLLLVLFVVSTDDSWVVFPAIVTALWVLALGVSYYRTRRRRQAMSTG